MIGSLAAVGAEDAGIPTVVSEAAAGTSITLSYSPVPTARIDPEIVAMPVVQAGDLRFRRMALGQGLSQTRVAQIVQDDEGFVWLGTQHGLNRFDGSNFRVFKPEPGRPDSLSGVFIYAVCKDSAGRIWVGSDQGLDVYERTTESFRHFTLDHPDPMVIHISQTKDGMLWLATSQGLYRMDPQTGEPKRFVHDSAEPRSLPSDDIKSTGEDRAGTFWVASSEGLDAFDQTTGHATFHIPLQESVREFSFHEDRSGTFWIIFGSGNGLALFDRKTGLLTHHRFYTRDIDVSGLTGVYAILEARDGTIWLGTMGAGLLRYDRERGRFLSYRNDPADPESLAENRVIALSQDLEGNIWVGLHASPPNTAPSTAPPFESIEPVAADPNSLGETLVNTVFQDSRGDLWMGSGGALSRLDRAAGTTRILDPLGSGAPIEVLTITEDRAGALWVGSLGTGLHRLDRGTQRFTSFRNDPADEASISSNIVTRLFIDRAGTLWATTWNGLNMFDPGTGSFIKFKRKPLSTAEPYFSMAEDKEGAYWLGSTTGLYKFEPSAGRFTSFTHATDDPSSLSNNTVNSVHVDSSGSIWVGTQNGLNLLDQTTGRFTAYYEKDGLPGSAVSCILEDGRGNLWMSTNNGVARMAIASRTFTNFSVADGLPGNDLTGWNACHRSETGEMFFGGFAGATAIRPEKLTDSTYVPPIRFTDLRISGERVQPSRPPLGRSITYADRLTLTAEQTNFAIEFAALSFSSPDTNRYRYRMVGLDRDWLKIASDQRAVSYATIPWGTYRFEVQAATSRGPWTSPGAALKIVVLPPWWRTWWFQVAYVTVLVSILIAAYRYRVRQVAFRYQIRLEERVNERTRIARDLHDSLLQGFQALMFRLQAVRDLLPHDPQRAIAQLDAALERADQATVEGRDAVHDLRNAVPTDSDLADALSALGDELQPSSTEAQATLKVFVEGRRRILGDAIRDEAYRIAREALRNAYRHSGATSVECELRYGEDRFRVHVRDNGRGLEPSVLQAGVRPGHWGLPGMRERAEQLGGTLTVWSAKGAGTELELSIPAEIAYEPRRRSRPEA